MYISIGHALTMSLMFECFALLKSQLAAVLAPSAPPAWRFPLFDLYACRLSLQDNRVADCTVRQ